MKKLIEQSLSKLGVALLILGIGGCQNRSGTPSYSVKRVSDGDTISVIDESGNNFNVRFACIDAPEIPHNQKERQSRKSVDKQQFKWGLQAQNRLQQMINQKGDRVILTVTDTDQYGRKISEVRLTDGTFVQEVLIREGLAMVYRPYLKNCPSSTIIQQAEVEAKNSRVGVWKDSKFLPPWEYRRESRK